LAGTLGAVRAGVGTVVGAAEGGGVVDGVVVDLSVGCGVAIRAFVAPVSIVVAAAAGFVVAGGDDGANGADGVEGANGADGVERAGGGA
jgi:hypothetical protein